MRLLTARSCGSGGLLVAAVVILWCIGVVSPTAAMAGYASIVIDEGTGEIITDVNADQVNHPASLTKMMTLYLAFEALRKNHLHWDQPLQVSTWASEKQPTKLGLEPGDEVSVRDCILGMIVLSANDAATVMGEALGGSEDGFARLMTQKARALGMTSTNFVNASGLPDEDQVTTARDLAKLAIALHRDFPDDYHYFSTREFEFRGRLILGHNHLMYRYPGMDGLKTGFTQSSGFNLASSAERNGRRLVGVVMGSQSAGARDRLMATLLDDGFIGRETDPMLVAEAGGQSPRTAHRLLVGAERVIASLSPVTRAEAAPLTRNTNAAAQRNTTGIMRGGVEPAAAPAGWSIQIGAYGHQAQALQAARQAEQTKGLSGHPTSVLSPQSGTHVYRARLDDFNSAKQARTACDALQHKGQACVVVPPGVKLAATRS